jgi:hypothetical protein
MAEQDKPAEAKPQAKKEPEPAPLGVAGESSDPLVQQLLAEREIVARNGDKAAVDALTEKLAALGVA